MTPEQQRTAIPFHEAILESYEQVKLYHGVSISLSGERRIEVWKIEGKEGFAVRIFRPTLDGKTSKLLFGLMPDAAESLARLLVEQIFGKTKGL